MTDNKTTEKADKMPMVNFNPCEYCGDGNPDEPCQFRTRYNITKGHDCIMRVEP